MKAAIGPEEAAIPGGDPAPARSARHAPQPPDRKPQLKLSKSVAATAPRSFEMLQLDGCEPLLS
jgi:hypothetical protein